MPTWLIQGTGAKARWFFLGAIVAIIAVNLLAFFPSSHGVSARYNVLTDGGTNDVFARVIETDNGRFGLAVWLSRFAADSTIYRAPADGIADRAVGQNLLGIGRTAALIEVPSFSDGWLKGVDYDALVVADAEPYEIRGSSPLATGLPWAVALDPEGEHKEFALFKPL